MTLQEDLDQLLLCLGQETRKVTDLSQAMLEAGLDPEAITVPIEEEYALMDLPEGGEEPEEEQEEGEQEEGGEGEDLL
jgi:hypothetical protein